MRRAALAAALMASTLVAAVLPAQSAQASPGGTISCVVMPGPTAGPPPCGTGIPSSSYTVTFTVTGAAAGSTYSWSVGSVFSRFGCGTGDNYCGGTVAPSSGGDTFVSGSVVVSQGGSSETLSTYADIPAVCGAYLC